MKQPSQNNSMYAIHNNYAVVLECDEDATSVVIPETIEGKPVTEIRRWTFAHCTSLKEITIPNTVTEIGEYAFDGCTSLNSIIVPDLVTEIGEWAFCDCTSLKEITIPEKFKNQLDNIFDGVNLDNVKINYTCDREIVETVEKRRFSVKKESNDEVNKNGN